ncbi:hypothetical protein FA13DRAFT_1736923 [Coprinellus micaceus]|uniref:Uncharacterized protein n=1 Tax=Coprinellus micaceus TaxID=71717 RepID=A0A4Y7SZP5_COPMI|nr:hypothetical protein FA13DRAFT_1736923 [Coprinellus micaceus]
MTTIVNDRPIDVKLVNVGLQWCKQVCRFVQVLSVLFGSLRKQLLDADRNWGVGRVCSRRGESRRVIREIQNL